MFCPHLAKLLTNFLVRGGDGSLRKEDIGPVGTASRRVHDAGVDVDQVESVVVHEVENFAQGWLSPAGVPEGDFELNEVDLFEELFAAAKSSEFIAFDVELEEGRALDDPVLGPVVERCYFNLDRFREDVGLVVGLFQERRRNCVGGYVEGGGAFAFAKRLGVTGDSGVVCEARLDPLEELGSRFEGEDFGVGVAGAHVCRVMADICAAIDDSAELNWTQKAVGVVFTMEFIAELAEGILEQFSNGIPQHGASCSNTINLKEDGGYGGEIKRYGTMVGAVGFEPTTSTV